MHVSEVGNDDKAMHLSDKWLKEGVTMAFMARTHIEQSLGKLETMMGYEFSTCKSPMAEGAHPELDDSPLLSTIDHSKFSKSGWMCKLVGDFGEV